MCKWEHEISDLFEYFYAAQVPDTASVNLSIMPPEHQSNGELYIFIDF